MSRPAPSQPDVLRDATPQPFRPLHKGYVDIATGLYVREDDDLALAGPLPVSLRRTYLSGDHVSRRFGVGTTHPGEWYLIGDSGRFAWAELILANGGRIRFDRTSEGTSWKNARFRHTKTPTSYFGSSLEWSSSEWLMRFNDRSEAVFQDCGPTDGKLCSLIEQRTPDGRQVLYTRDQSGRLLKIQSGDQAIMLAYDDRRRIVEAWDTSEQRVIYTYDDQGRLSRVTTSDGTIRSYTYSPRHEMLTIREPGWFIENWFDDAGRCIQQTTRLSDSDEPLTLKFTYSIVDGVGTQTDVTQYDGTRTSHRFDANRYLLSVTYDADGRAPLTASYDRDPATNLAHGMTITCVGPTEMIRTVRSSPIPEYLISRSAVLRECAVPRR